MDAYGWAVLEQRHDGMPSLVAHDSYPWQWGPSWWHGPLAE